MFDSKVAFLQLQIATSMPMQSIHFMHRHTKCQALWSVKPFIEDDETMYLRPESVLILTDISLFFKLFEHVTNSDRPNKLRFIFNSSISFYSNFNWECYGTFQINNVWPWAFPMNFPMNVNTVLKLYIFSQSSRLFEYWIFNFHSPKIHLHIFINFDGLIFRMKHLTRWNIGF